MRRCHWVDLRNPLYIQYHDEQWGRALHDDHDLFELLILEGFQAGLSWQTILNKREAFREAFDQFDAKKIAAYDDTKVASLLKNEGIIRHRLKILAAITNAKVFISIQKEFGSFDAYLWAFSHHKIICEYDRTTSPLSDAISKDLKHRGMKYVGSTIIYAYLQAMGMIDSHEPDCFLYRVVKKEG